jgi:SAM-dependent methyltransferase
MPFRSASAEYYELHPGYMVRDVMRYNLLDDNHKQFLKFYRNCTQNNKILDLGCGTGNFINELKKRGCDVWGVDIDKNAIEFIKKHFRLENVYAMSFDEFFKLPNLPKFDVITFFEVIEHIDNPLEFIQNVRKLLKEDGMIVLSTPSRERYFVNYLQADFPPNHLTRWNEKAISNLFRKINFEVIRVDYVKPFKFILDTISERFRFNLVAKTVNLLRNKEKGIQENSVQKKLFLAKLVHFGAYLKDYLLFGIPATILFLIGKLTKRKNGDMLIWLKREK